MNIKSRIRKLEAVSVSRTASGELHGITLDEWRHLAKGEDILPLITERNRAAFLEWQRQADERRRQAEETMRKFED
jgi:hypothetical protein